MDYYIIKNESKYQIENEVNDKSINVAGSKTATTKEIENNTKEVINNIKNEVSEEHMKIMEEMPVFGRHQEYLERNGLWPMKNEYILGRGGNGVVLRHPANNTVFKLLFSDAQTAIDLFVEE